MPSKRAGGGAKRPARASRPASSQRKPTPKAAKAAKAAGSGALPRSARSARPARTPKSAVRHSPLRTISGRPDPARPVSGRPAPARPSRVVKGRLLTKREVGDFKKTLERERDRLTEELDAIEEHLPEVEHVSVDASGAYDEDLADVASDAFEREKGIAIENSVQNLLRQVEEALGRIQDGAFGICEMCAQPIHPDRLKALPYARLCINCKEREEQAIPR